MPKELYLDTLFKLQDIKNKEKNTEKSQRKRVT